MALKKNSFVIEPQGKESPGIVISPSAAHLEERTVLVLQEQPWGNVNPSEALQRLGTWKILEIKVD